MIGPVFDFDDVRRISRLGERSTLATVERWARKVGLQYNYDGRGGIWTTLDALNAAVGLTMGQAKGDEKYSMDMVV